MCSNELDKSKMNFKTQEWNYLETPWIQNFLNKCLNEHVKLKYSIVFLNKV